MCKSNSQNKVLNLLLFDTCMYCHKYFKELTSGDGVFKEELTLYQIKHCELIFRTIE